jgi:hypothetical protein
MNRFVAASSMVLALCCALFCLDVSAAAPARGAPIELDSLYGAIWQRWLREDPTLATSVGDTRYNDRWPDLSPTAIDAAVAADRAALGMLTAIDAAGLAAPDRRRPGGDRLHRAAGVRTLHEIFQRPVSAGVPHQHRHLGHAAGSGILP